MFFSKAKLSLIVILSSSLFVSCLENGKVVTSDVSEAHKEVYSENEPKSISFWWPERLDLSPLRQHSKESNPYGEDYSYAEEFASIDMSELKSDVEKVLTKSQEWWPADYGHYGPFFIRLAWHSAGTYRTTDGRGGAGGGQHRLEPLNSWPDNANLDKARRLLWPVKKKYGSKLSWADLMILSGTVAMESMGFKTMGFAGGRTDDWEPDLVYWGPETKMLSDKGRYHGKGKNEKLKKPLGAVQMGLIYVNPEGPGGNHDPLDAARHIRESFGRMAMNDEETFALIAGGHTFGKAHGAHKPEDCVGSEPAAAGIEEQGFGWKNKCGEGKGKDTVTSGLEGAWTSAPTKWTYMYLTNLMSNEWVQTKSPAGATQWVPAEGKLKDTVPDAHVKDKKHQPIMFTTDLALKMDPEYNKIAKRFVKEPKLFEAAFARAWFKLTHRDMGPVSRYVGEDAPLQSMSWQDPINTDDYKVLSASEAKSLKSKIMSSGLTVSELVKAAWASASSFRNTDMRGGANGARVRLAPQKNWEVNNPNELSKTLDTLTKIQKEFNENSGEKASLADIIVLGGNAAVEKASADAGYNISVSFNSGRGDATQAQTDVASFSNLEPKADAFRNYYSDESLLPPLKMMIDRANTLGLTVPEMTVLIGGMRVLGANSDNSKHGYFTDRVGVLSNDFFVNLMDMSTEWKKSSTDGLYEGFDRGTGDLKYTATPVDLIFGSHSELRAVAEVYAADDGAKRFAKDFSRVWSKVMNADRFDLN